MSSPPHWISRVIPGTFMQEEGAMTLQQLRRRAAAGEGYRAIGRDRRA